MKKKERKEKERKGKKKFSTTKKKFPFQRLSKGIKFIRKFHWTIFVAFFLFLFRSGKFFTNLHSHTHTLLLIDLIYFNSRTFYTPFFMFFLLYFTLLSKKRIKYSFFLCLSYYQDIIFDFTIDVRIPDFHGDNNYNNQKKKIDQFDWWRMILVLLIGK